MGGERQTTDRRIYTIKLMDRSGLPDVMTAYYTDQEAVHVYIQTKTGCPAVIPEGSMWERAGAAQHLY